MKLNWGDVDEYLAKKHINLCWVSEAIRTEGFNVDSMSKCQLVSKFRLIELLDHVPNVDGDIVIVGAWYGQLAMLINEIGRAHV